MKFKETKWKNISWIAMVAEKGGDLSDKSFTWVQL
jgi:hypothetical protein